MPPLPPWTPLAPAWTKPAAKQLSKLPKPDRASVEAGVNRYAATGVGDIRVLNKDRSTVLRVGNFRVRIAILAATNTLQIEAVAHRREAYD